MFSTDLSFYVCGANERGGNEIHVACIHSTAAQGNQGDDKGETWISEGTIAYYRAESFQGNKDRAIDLLAQAYRKYDYGSEPFPHRFQPEVDKPIIVRYGLINVGLKAFRMMTRFHGQLSRVRSQETSAFLLKKDILYRPLFFARATLRRCFCPLSSRVIICRNAFDFFPGCLLIFVPSHDKHFSKYHGA